MEIENNSLFREQSNNFNNNRRGLLKFIASLFINIFFVFGFILYSMKYNIVNDYSFSKEENIILNSSINLRNLDIKNIIQKKDNYSTTEDETKNNKFLFIENIHQYDSLHHILLDKPVIMSKEVYYYQKEKQIFLSRLIKNIYSGTWESFPYNSTETLFYKYKNKKNISVSEFYYLNSSNKNFKIGNSVKGTVTLNFQQAIEMIEKQEALAITMKNIEGDYIDNWMLLMSYGKMRDLNRTIDYQNNKYLLKGVFLTSMMNGHIFYNNMKNKRFYKKNQNKCSTLVEMSFPLTYVTLKTNLNNKTTLIKNISTIDPSNFTMVLSSLCGFRIKINAEIYDRPKKYNENKIKVNYYSYFSF